MTAERAVSGAIALTRMWANIYTLAMARTRRAERLAELESDLHEQRTAAGRDSYVLAWSILFRALRGAPADALNVAEMWLPDRVLRRLQEPLAAAGVAAIVATGILLAGLPTVDFATHVYQRAIFLQHGFALWNNFWYAGRYSFVTYSLLFYPLAGVVGVEVVAVVAVALAALMFSVVVLRQWGRDAIWSSRTFAVVWGGIVLSAAFPFALGTAMALLAIWALQRRRLWRFYLLASLTVLASPLAFLVLTATLAGIAIGRHLSSGSSESRRIATS